MRDADKAEVQYYHFQKKIDRLKAAFVGSKLAIARIFTSILPVAALFLPLVKGSFFEPFVPLEGSISVLTLYEMLGEFDFGVFSELIAQPETKNAAICLLIAVAGLLLSVVLLVFHFILLTLACSPKGKIRNYIIDALTAISAIAAGIGIIAAPDNSIFSLKLGIGAFLYVLLIAVNIGVDIATLVKGIEIKHKQCYVGGIPIEEYFEMLENGATHEELRREMYKRLDAIQAEKERQLAEKEKEEQLK